MKQVPNPFWDLFGKIKFWESISGLLKSIVSACRKSCVFAEAL